MVAVYIAMGAMYVYRIQPPTNPTIVNLPSPSPELVPNTDLAKLEKMYSGSFQGPEAFAFDENGVLYSGLSDGRIVRVSTTDSEPWQPELVLFTGNPQQALPFPCGEVNTEKICGRPLGMKFDQNGKLIVADAYFGLLRVDVEKGTQRSLSKKPSRPKKSKKRKRSLEDTRAFGYTNALDISSSGLVYFTDSDKRYPRSYTAFSLIDARPTGRLMVYNPKEKKTKVLLSDLYFPNGVVVAPDGSYVLFAETTMSRIRKLHRKGPKKGEVEIFADNLPCMPDNLNWGEDSDNLKLYVGCPFGRPNLLDRFGTYPEIRQFLSKIVPLDWWMSWLGPSSGLVLVFDESGTIISSPQDPEGKKAFHISSAVPYNGYLYLGSFDAKYKYLGRIPLSEEA